jgi:hypothetical protein
MKAPGGERRYSSYTFSTSAIDGASDQHHTPATLYPRGKDPGTHWWAPEPVWTQRLEEKSSASVGDRTPVVQSVARHYTD